MYAKNSEQWQLWGAAVFEANPIEDEDNFEADSLMMVLQNPGCWWKTAAAKPINMRENENISARQAQPSGQVRYPTRVISG